MKRENSIEIFPKIINGAMGMDDDDDDRDDTPIYRSSSTSSSTPALDSFSRDLTTLAAEGKLDPIVGRDSEIERVPQILARRKKNNPVLIGDPGVGKSAIAEGLALRIVQRKVSRNLLNKRVVSLDMGSIVAGTKYRGNYRDWETDRKSTRLNSSHSAKSRMPSSA